MYASFCSSELGASDSIFQRAWEALEKIEGGAPWYGHHPGLTAIGRSLRKEWRTCHVSVKRLGTTDICDYVEGGADILLVFESTRSGY